MTAADLAMVCILQSALLLALLASDSSGSGEVYDYCPSEYFDVACQDNEVIMMESAKYGRMREGRCISRSYQMGCALDVLSFLDNKCSGRQQCNVYVADPFLHNKKPCGMDLASYLEAAYSCVPVAGATRTHCTSPITLESPSGYIASSKTVQYGLGTLNCPWVINAKEGQRITVYLFTLGGRVDDDPADSSADVCYELGSISEPDTPPSIVTSCSGQRYREVYSSTGRRVQLQLLSPDVLNELVPFVVFFQAEGCEMLVAPPGGWLQIDGDTAEIGCHHSPEVWFMTCQGSKWIGQISNCTAVTSDQHQEDSSTTFPYGILIVVAIGVALGVFFGGALLTVVAVYMKGRHRQQQERENSSAESPYQQCHLASKRAHLASYDDTVTIRMSSTDPYNTTSKALADQELYNTQRKSGHVYESPQFS